MAEFAKHHDSPLLGMGFRLLAVFFVASTFASVKHVTGKGVHIIEPIFYRYLFGCLFMGGYVLFKTGWDTLKTNRLSSHFFRAMAGLFTLSMNFWSYTLMPLAEASFISFAAPLISTILSVVILSEFVGIRRWTAVLIGFTGILIAIRPDGSDFTTLGVVVGLLAATGAAYVTILMRDLSKTESTSTILIYSMILVMPVLGVLMWIYGSVHGWEIYAWLLLIGVLGTLATATFTESLRHASVALAAPVDYAIFVFSAGFGFFLWDELPPITVWFGLPFIVGPGVYLVLRERLKTRDL